MAAAGIVALEKMVDRLAEDHANARRLANGIARIEGLTIDVRRVQTNIAFFDLVDRRIAEADLIAGLREQGVLLHHAGPHRFRMVVHHGIGEPEIDKAVAALESVVRK